MKPLDLHRASRPKAFQTTTSRKVRHAALQIALQLEGKILDVGCGNGLFLLEWYATAAKFPLAFGLDYDHLAIAETNSLFHDNQLPLNRFIVGDAFQMPFAANTFDNIFCLNTLINISPFERVGRLLTEIHRICRPGGLIIFDYRNAFNPYLASQYFFNSITKRLTTHGNSRRQFRPLISKLGIKERQRVPIASPLPGFPLGYLNIWEK